MEILTLLAWMPCMQKMQEQFSVTVWVTPNGHNVQRAPRSVVGITGHAEHYAGWALLLSTKIFKKALPSAP